jgi:hypothetical protein
MTRTILALLAAALAFAPAAPTEATELLSGSDRGGLAASVDRAQADFVRQQTRSDRRAARNREIVAQSRRASQLAIGLDNPESGAFADFREFEADIRRLERRRRALDARLEALPPGRATARDVEPPPERPPFPDSESFDVPPELADVEIPQSAEARRERARAFVNELLRANEARRDF